MSKSSKKIVILGVGNILIGDEGVGVHIVEEIEKIGLPENVEVIAYGGKDAMKN